MTTTVPTSTAQTTAQTTSKEDAVSVSTAAAATAAPVGSTPATGRPTRKVNIPYASVLLPLAVLAVVVAVWYLVSYVFLDESRRFLMPPPDQVVTEGLFGPNAGEMWQALWQTTKIAMTGLLIAAVIGIVWAIVMAQSKRAETALFPYAVFLQCIPVLALVPLIGFWFGFGFSARVFVCVLIALFPMVSNTLFGLQSVDPGMRDLFALHKPSRLTVLRKLEMPAAMPSIFVGLRTSGGLAVVGAIVGDFFFKQGTPGIGVLLDNYRSRLQSPDLFAAIILASLLGVVVFLVFGLIGNRVVGRWYGK
ncbi:ABC transporter permease [Corynebacterium variabile]|uniref:ABC transport system permease protein n=1 Tax=Corynebacterium variabile (strain DSM 44702 / CIP 107183 / JCM 12073 / NCIMB 30131) TaxID=858619 RepID=G0HH03_CORVD|nr:ABC transporter permease [Corynebacterium variabile]AEK37991.1 ABC transport system permease protein [Corynebacterium variabile DSM 44702]MDN6815130.1 ABC transporter permease [Corynebacterium variabile]